MITTVNANTDCRVYEGLIIVWTYVEIERKQYKLIAYILLKLTKSGNRKNSTSPLDFTSDQPHRDTTLDSEDNVGVACVTVSHQWSRGINWIRH